jgi:hypothetical protein
MCICGTGFPSLFHMWQSARLIFQPDGCRLRLYSDAGVSPQNQTTALKLKCPNFISLIIGAQHIAPLCDSVNMTLVSKITVLCCKKITTFLSLAVVMTSLTACANNPAAKNLEQSLAADSRLKDNPLVFGQTPTPTPTQSTVQLPSNFPKDIPQYPGSELKEVINSGNTSTNSTSIIWLSADPINLIEGFYFTLFKNNGWEILQQPTDEQPGIFQVKRNDLQVKITIKPKSVANPAPNQPQTASELIIEYGNQLTAASPSPTSNPTSTPTTSSTNTNPTTSPETNTNTAIQPENPNFIGPVLPGSIPTPTTATTPNTSTTVTGQEFSDINKAPKELQQYIQDLAALNILSGTGVANKSNAPSNLFEPGKNITRKEFARLLVMANNTMYSNNPAKQIRLATESSQPTFTDIPKNHPDFAFIQGLAEAGLIPSPLSGDSTSVLFNPDAPLLREQMLLWKTPLDTRQTLPSASLDAVKQTWGFQDAGKIDPKALRAILADYQNGEQSNIKRVFGYTTIFQPKKPVTRAEAAGVLWYFGIPGEGVSAKDAKKLTKTP